MGALVADADGERDDRRGTISVFNGPEPLVVIADTAEAERKAIAEFVKASLADGVEAEKIGVFVRTRDVIVRARDAVKSAGAEPFELTRHKEGPLGAVRIGIMHLAMFATERQLFYVACIRARDRLERILSGNTTLVGAGQRFPRAGRPNEPLAQIRSRMRTSCRRSPRFSSQSPARCSRQRQRPQGRRNGQNEERRADKHS